MTDEVDGEILKMVERNANFYHQQSSELSQMMAKESDPVRRSQLTQSTMLQQSLEMLFLVSQWNIQSIISIKKSVEKLPNRSEFEEVKNLLNEQDEQLKQRLLQINRAFGDLTKFQDEDHDIYG